jgi:hypothetical protein|tara:strand:+ start:284 stop:532 length:249 start_codon:yes stop_codon:yes gene_type:complete
MGEANSNYQSLINTYRKLQQEDSENEHLNLIELVDNNDVIAYSEEYRERFIFDGDETDEPSWKRCRHALEEELKRLSRNQNN